MKAQAAYRTTRCSPLFVTLQLCPSFSPADGEVNSSCSVSFPLTKHHRQEGGCLLTHLPVLTLEDSEVESQNMYPSFSIYLSNSTDFKEWIFDIYCLLGDIFSPPQHSWQFHPTSHTKEKAALGAQCSFYISFYKALWTHKFLSPEKNTGVGFTPVDQMRELCSNIFLKCVLFVFKPTHVFC